MKNTKKILSVLLAVCMLASFLPMIALAANNDPIGDDTDWDDGEYIGDADVKVAKLSDSPLKLSVTVTLNGKVLREGRDYTVSTYEDTAAGTVTVMVMGQPPYYYSMAMRTFKIDELESCSLIQYILQQFLQSIIAFFESFFKLS